MDLARLRQRALATLGTVDWTGPLLVRLALGLVFVTTGWGKLHHQDDVSRFFASLGLPLPGATALLVASTELVAGALLLAGLATRVAAATLTAVMAVAILTAKLPALHGVVDLAGTLETAYLAALVWLVVAGPGRASLDHLLVQRAGRRPTAIAA